MLFSQCRSNADEHTLTQISFLTNYECWNNIGSSTVNRRNSVNLVSTLFCQCWNNVDKHTSAQLSFSTKFQRWNNIGSSTLNRRNSINVVSTLFCQRWNNVDKCTSAQLSFSTKYQRWNNVDERWRSMLFQHCLLGYCIFPRKLFFQWAIIFLKFFMFHLLYFLSYGNTIKHDSFPLINKIMNFVFKF